MINKDYKPDEVRCLLCPDLDGLIIKVGSHWVHKTCVNWNNDIYFRNTKEGEESNIYNISKILKQ